MPPPRAGTRQRERERGVERVRERLRDQVREELVPGEDRGLGVRERGQVAAEQVRDRVVAEEASRTGVETGGRWAMFVGDRRAGRRGRSGRGRASSGSCAESPMIISEKKIPIESTCAENVNVDAIPEPTPRRHGGSAVHDRGAVGRDEHPHADPVERRAAPRTRRRGSRPAAARAGRTRPRRAAAPRVANGRAPKRSESTPESGPASEQAADQRQHVDARPQRRAREVVAVLGQPDPLQPDHEDELQAAAREEHHQARDVADRERAAAEQAELEQRLRDARLDQRRTAASRNTPPPISPSTRGLAQLIAWCP